jgi:hypothetical protein
MFSTCGSLRAKVYNGFLALPITFFVFLHQLFANISHHKTTRIDRDGIMLIATQDGAIEIQRS